MTSRGAMDLNEIRPDSLRDSLKLAAGALRARPPTTVPGAGAATMSQTIHQFRQRSGPCAFALGANPVLVRETYATRLEALAGDPRLLHQQVINGCGMAAFLFMWLRNDLRNAIQYAIDLFEQGEARIGSLTIQPSQDLLREDYASLVARRSGPMPDTVDWVMMSALRNATQPAAPRKFLGDPKQAVEAIVLPHEITDWMRATGNYTNVENSANAILPQQLDLIDRLSPSRSTDVAVLMHTEMLVHATKTGCDQASGKLGEAMLALAVPNHYVVLDARVAPAGRGLLSFSFWCWGDHMTRTSCMPYVLPKSAFEKYFYGAVVGQK